MIRHIVAIDSKRGIAKNGVQPWNLPVDEHYFSEQTKLHGGIVLMGRKTFDVVGPLPDRQNFVLTRDASFVAEGVEPVHDLKSFLSDYQDIWIIGGAQLYSETLSIADVLYITEIDANFQCDVFYPEYSNRFEQISDSGPKLENGVSFSFKVYKPHRP